ncbi:MAG TPA: hypothetical protein VJA94_18150 [Candidatus Angelobacter sp.]
MQEDIMDSAKNDPLAELSNRQKQAYAALCLAQFCAAKRIEHPALHQFIEQRLSILIAWNLFDWNDEFGFFADFDKQGNRYWPPSPKTFLPSDIPEKDFDLFAECVAEVGSSETYGPDTKLPHHYLLQCIETLRRYGVEPPPLEIISSLPRKWSWQPDGMPWGRPIGDEQFKIVLAECRKILASATH